ncbi:MAG: AsmA-like C-terminal region-containing protein, partial [Hyphomicrobiales bacterium]
LEGAEEQPLLVSAKMFARKNAVEKTSLEANFVLGKNRGIFSGSIGMSGERIKTSGNVAMSYLDLPSLAETLLLEKKKDDREDAWSNRLFRRDALSRFGGDLSVKSEEMKLSEKLVLSDTSFLFTASAGALEISALNGNPGNGTFDGAFKLSAGDVAAQEFSATFSLENLDLDPWLKNETGRALGSGTISINGNLKASGRSPAGLVSDLSGAGNWSLAAAQVFGIDPAGFSARLKEAGKTITIDDLIAKRLKKGRLSVGPAKGAWRVQAGLLRTDPIEIKNKSAAATFSVFADLPARKFDASWSLKLPSDPELPVFVIALAGPFGNLDRTYDTSALKSFLVVRELEQGVDKLEELQAEQQRIYEEQKRLEEEEEARRRAEEAKKEAERQARLKLEEEERRKAEQAEQEERLREEREARRQLEEELKRLEAEQQRSKQETSLQDAKERARRAKQQEQQKQREWLEFLDETARTEDRNAAPQENAEHPLPLDTVPSAQNPTVISPPASQTVIRKVLPPIDGLDKK